MEALEIIKTLVLFIIAIEGACILYKKDEKLEGSESTHTSRRDVYGTFKDPYSYRKNNRSQYVPIKPNSKMLDGVGDDEE